MFLLAFQALLKVDTWTFHPCWHIDEDQHVTFECFIETQTIEGIDKHIDSFILELIASTCADNHRIICKVGSQKVVCHIEHYLTGFLTCIFERLSLCWNEVVFEAVRQHHVYLLLKQCLAFCSCDVAHGGETINIVCCLLLDGMLGLHVQFPCHLVTIIRPQIVVERFVIACDTTSDTSGMGGKDGSNLGNVLL